MKNIAKKITIIVLTVALSCCPLFQKETAAAVKLCDENLTWVYQDTGPATQMMYEMSFSSSKTAPNGKDYSVFKIKRSISNGPDGIQTWGASDAEPEEEWLFRQDNDKVYMYDTYLYSPDLYNRPDNEILMYDFAAKTGDLFPGAQESDGVFKEMGDPNMMVQCLNDTLLGGEKRRMYTFKYGLSDEDRDARDYIKIIEGIGTTAGWLASQHVLIRACYDCNYSLTPGKPGYKSRLVAVYDNNGNFIYGDEESYIKLLNEVTGISVIMDNDDDAVPTYYNLQGQRISAPEKGQICIEHRDGKARKIIM